MGGLEAADPGAVRTGIGTFDMTEQFTLQQVFVEGGAIDFDIRLVTALTGPVDRTGHEFLAAAAFPLGSLTGVSDWATLSIISNRFCITGDLPRMP